MLVTDRTISATALVAGQANGRCLKLTEPLNAWGGLDPESGVIVHHSHPQRGQSLAGRVLVMQESRGSGTNAQVFAQAWANGKGPLAVLLAAPDFVLCVGAIVSDELYEVACPVVVLNADDYAAVVDGQFVSVNADDHRAVVSVTGCGSTTPRDSAEHHDARGDGSMVVIRVGCPKRTA